MHGDQMVWVNPRLAQLSRCLSRAPGNRQPWVNRRLVALSNGQECEESASR